VFDKFQIKTETLPRIFRGSIIDFKPELCCRCCFIATLLAFDRLLWLGIIIFLEIGVISINFFNSFPSISLGMKILQAG
jgi:hypothetical protein